MNEKWSTKGYFTGFSTRADKSFGLRFNTQEMSAEELKQLADAVNSYGEITFTQESEPGERDNQ